MKPDPKMSITKSPLLMPSTDADVMTGRGFENVHNEGCKLWEAETVLAP